MIFRYCFPLYLLKSPQHPDKQNLPYVLRLRDRSLHVSCPSTPAMGWKWALVHLRRYCYEPKVPYIEIEAGRSAETGEGCFYFTGKQCSKLYDLILSLQKHSKPTPLGTKPKSTSVEIPTRSQHVMAPNTPTAGRHSDNHGTVGSYNIKKQPASVSYFGASTTVSVHQKKISDSAIHLMEPMTENDKRSSATSCGYLEVFPPSHSNAPNNSIGGNSPKQVGEIQISEDLDYDEIIEDSDVESVPVEPTDYCTPIIDHKYYYIDDEGTSISISPMSNNQVSDCEYHYVDTSEKKLAHTLSKRLNKLHQVAKNGTNESEEYLQSRGEWLSEGKKTDSDYVVTYDEWRGKPNTDHN